MIHGSSVWKYDGVRSVTGLVSFCTQGYKAAAAIPYMKSPMGVVGQIKGAAISTGFRVIGIYEHLTGVLKLPAAAAIAVMGVVGIAGMFVGMVFLIWLVSPSKPKED